MEKDVLYKMKSVIVGHAVGDALGVPVEFGTREELDGAPVEDMEGFGSYPYPAGAWSDDTSMSLCALDSLAKGRVDWEEIMQNFKSWIEQGAYTSVGECFDAVINSITSFGFFAELDNTCEGLVPIGDLCGSFVFDEKNLSLRSRDIVYRIGDSVRVCLEEADIIRGKLRFSVVDINY